MLHWLSATCATTNLRMLACMLHRRCRGVGSWQGLALWDRLQGGLEPAVLGILVFDEDQWGQRLAALCRFSVLVQADQA